MKSNIFYSMPCFSRRCFYFICGAMLLSNNAVAFKGEEHKGLADLSLNIAVDIFVKRNDVVGIRADEFTKAVKPLILCGEKDCASNKEKSGNTYSGHETYGDIVELVDFTLEPSKMFARIGDGEIYPRSHTELNRHIFGEYKDTDLSYLRASHVNEAHFQAELLFNFHHWHLKAIQLAKYDKNLFSALVSNAISDHYMHDFFAPGHIITPRVNNHDAFSLGMHDKNNELGANFILRNLHELSEILEYINSYNEEKKLGFVRNDIEYFTSNPTNLRLYGDGLLSDNPRQKILMILVEVRSILDVFENYYSDDINYKNSFDNYSWYTTEATNVEKVKIKEYTPPVAIIQYGKYEIENKNVLEYKKVLGVSVAQESIYIEDGQNRLNVTLELVPFGYSGSPDFVRRKSDKKPFGTLNFAPSIGFTFVDAKDYLARGLTARGTFAFPKVDMLTSIYARYLNYDNGKTDEHKLSYGMRLDIGFSFVTAYFSVGEDYGFDDSSAIKKAFLFTSGISFTFPL